MPNDSNIRLAHDDEPSLDVFTKSSKPKKSKSKIDRPEILSEEKPAPKPPEDDSRKDDHPEIADIPEDLTIEPEPCDVLASADVKTPGKMKKLRRTQGEEEITYSYPPIDLLEPGEDVEHNYREEDMRKAKLLTDTLEEFHISTTLTGIAHGPAVTRFVILPAPGVKVTRLGNLSDDMAGP